MEVAAGLAALVVLGGGLTALLAALGGWARSAEASGPALSGDVAGAFSLAGVWPAAWGALQRAPLPLLVGGAVMSIVDGRGGGGGSGVSGPSGDTGLGEGLESIDPMVVAGVIAVVLVATVVCMSVLLALRAWLVPGWVRMVRDTLVSGAPELGTLFSSTDRFGAMFGWQLVKALLMVTPFLAAFGVVGAVVAAAGDVPSAAGFAVIGVACLLAVGQAVWLGSGLVLGDYFVALDGLGPLSALQRSLHGMAGARLSVIVFAVVWGILCGLIALSGVFALCIGLLVTIPAARALADTGWCRAYLLARDGHDAELGWVR